MLKFVVGLTDNKEYDGFIYDDRSVDDTSVNYNIRRPSTDIEKATIEWRINTDLDAMRNVIPLWEKIIRAPHLCMIGFNEQPYRFYPDFKEYNISVSFINLLPISTDLIKEFTDNDYEQCCGEAQFGDLCIYMHENIISPNPHGANITGAYYKKDISVLSDASVRGAVLPKFFAQFPLRGNEQPHNWFKDEQFVEFVAAHKDVIEQKGYDINSNRILNYGPITIGKLLNDPGDTYDNISKYPRICRTSFVQTED